MQLVLMNESMRDDSSVQNTIVRQFDSMRVNQEVNKLEYLH